MYLLHKTERSAHTSLGIFQGHQDDLLLPKENKLLGEPWGAGDAGAWRRENHMGQHTQRHTPSTHTRPPTHTHGTRIHTPHIPSLHTPHVYILTHTPHTHIPLIYALRTPPHTHSLTHSSQHSHPHCDCPSQMMPWLALMLFRLMSCQQNTSPVNILMKTVDSVLF